MTGGALETAPWYYHGIHIKPMAISPRKPSGACEDCGVDLNNHPRCWACTMLIHAGRLVLPGEGQFCDAHGPTRVASVQHQASRAYRDELVALIARGTPAADIYSHFRLERRLSRAVIIGLLNDSGVSMGLPTSTDEISDQRQRELQELSTRD